MPISKPTPRTVNLLLIFVGLVLVGCGIIYCIGPSSTFMTVTSATGQAELSARESAETLTALSQSRPWDHDLAAAAWNARQEANHEANVRAVITVLFVGGGAALGFLGGRRLAAGRKPRAVPPLIAPATTGPVGAPPVTASRSDDP